MRKEVYALASIAGCVLYYFIFDKMNFAAASYITAGFITIIRVIASWRRVNLSYAIKNDNLKIDE